jgi:2-polyprenyl-3-methyl-5-hydroxy-6-metoxy-1,4-benzoquinol methylase
MSVYSNNQLKTQASNEAWTKLFSFIEPGATVLDIGCSSGQLGAALKKQKQVHVIGLDIDKDDVELAKHNLDEAYVSNIETDDLSQYGTFDYVMMADVVEHLMNPIAALKKVRKLLKPGGKFVFSIPNMANVTTRIELLKGSFMYKDFGLLDRTHLHFYDQTEVNRVLSEAGFTVQDMDCTTREIPEDLLKQELDGVGIALTPKLHKVLSQPDATIYQFIGVAVPGKATKKMKVATTTPLDIISVEIENVRMAHQAEVRELRAHAARLDKRILELDHALQTILNSRSWKAVQTVRGVKRRLIGRK